MPIDPSGSAVLATIYTLLVLATLIVGARLYLRVIIQKRCLLLSDVLMILAWCAAITTSSFDAVLYDHGVLKPDMDFAFEQYHGSPQTLEYLLKIYWVASLPYFTTFFLFKSSLLAMYLDLFPLFMTKQRIALWGVISYCTVGYIVIVLLQLFLCFPIERNWSVFHPEKLRNEMVTVIIFITAWGLNFSGSIAVFLLPFSILHNLNMHIRVKVGLFCVFFLGLIDIIFTLIRFLLSILNHSNGFRSTTEVELWAALDIYIGLIVACLPSLRPFLSRDARQYYGTSRSRNIDPNNSRPHNRLEQGGFEEIGHIDISRDRAVQHINSPKLDSSSTRNSLEEIVIFREITRSNRSSIELVDIINLNK